MSKKCPDVFPELDLEGLRAALPVRGADQWRDYAQASNYLVGYGGTLANIPPTVIVAAGSLTNNFSVRPSAFHLTRVWVVTLGPPLDTSQAGLEPTEAHGTFTSTYDNGTDTGTESADWTLSGSQPKTFYVRHDRDTGDSAPGQSTEVVELTITNATASLPDIRLHSAFLVELPKRYMDTADDGVTDDTLIAPHPIADTGDSIDEAYIGPEDIKDDCRRRHLFSWSNGNVGVGTSTTAWTNLMRQDPYVLGRLLSSGETTRTVRVNARVSINSSTTAEIRVVAGSGDTYTFTGITNQVSGAWLGWNGIDIDCDEIANLGTNGGIRTGGRETLTFEARITAGSGTLTTIGLVVAEDGT